MNWTPTEEDKKRIEAKGIPADTIRIQLEKFESGFDSIKLTKPATLNDGIHRLSDKEQEYFISIYRSYKGSASKFVPASGAATRMFSDLLDFRSVCMGADKEYKKIISSPSQIISNFFNSITLFAFHDQLKTKFTELNEYSLEEALEEKEYISCLNVLLEEKGLNYKKLPKGLLAFHRYGNDSRTAVQEQIVEGFRIVTSDELNIHFTVSEDHLALFRQHLKSSIPYFTKAKKLNFSFSLQDPATDTIAVSLGNEPIRDEKGKLVFRPAGHGALLENLDKIESDIVFIKNIDNILPDYRKHLSIHFKQVLAGVLIDYQRKAFRLLDQFDQGVDVHDEAISLLEQFGIIGIPDEKIMHYLNRPVRVCGMVKNIGEPGGGPFWVSNGSKQSLQIVEGVQVDKEKEDQKYILKQSTHFNPVDLVCGLRDYKGRKFNLLDYRDNDLGFITQKSYQGKKIKAMELPGLWNGGMADWNTVFVEVPLETFSPVKTINDLLKEEHR